MRQVTMYVATGLVGLGHEEPVTAQVLLLALATQETDVAVGRRCQILETWSTDLISGILSGRLGLHTDGPEGRDATVGHIPPEGWTWSELQGAAAVRQGSWTVGSRARTKSKGG